MNKYLLFKFKNELYALNINYIKEIIEYKEPSSTLKPEEHILGIITVRERAITLMNSLAVLNENLNKNYTSGKILILDNSVGFLVDDVDSVISIKNDDIQPSPLSSIVAKKDRVDYVSGVYNHDGKLVIIINLEKTRIFNS